MNLKQPDNILSTFFSSYIAHIGVPVPQLIVGLLAQLVV
jgi:hypothetical protein